DAAAPQGPSTPGRRSWQGRTTIGMAWRDFGGMGSRGPIQRRLPQSPRSPALIAASSSLASTSSTASSRSAIHNAEVGEPYDFVQTGAFRQFRPLARSAAGRQDPEWYERS